MTTIYKYRIYNDLNLKMLTNNRLYFSAPVQFNDPFDGLFYIEDDADTKEYIETVRSLRSRLGLTEDQFSKMVNSDVGVNSVKRCIQP